MTTDQAPDQTDSLGPTSTRPAFVRPAKPDDEETLRRLRAQAALVRNAEFERQAAVFPELRADWSNVNRRVWLGGLENTELGYLLGAIVPLASRANVGVIEAIYVESEARACGIGERMLSVALDWFRAQACVGVEATALPGARATKNFFEEHGLKTRLLTVYCSLTANDATDV